jgi:transposase
MPTELSKKEFHAYETIKALTGGKITVNQASGMLEKSPRTIFRLIGKYRNEGKKGFSHKLKKAHPKNKTRSAEEKSIAEFYLAEYQDFNFSHFCDFIRKERPKNTPRIFFDLSDRTIARILKRRGIKSPKGRKRKKKESHPSRLRKPSFGELVQIDGSLHDWLGNGTKFVLHIAIDDATSRILAARFERQETLRGYFGLLYQILTLFGVPKCFYADNRSGFEEKSGKDPLGSNSHFMKALAELGIDMKTTSVPQAKGRVERTFRTHQDRLVNELKALKAESMEEAERYLRAYVINHNDRFTESEKGLPSSFMPIPKGKDIDKILCLSNERTVLSGNVVSYGDSQYMPLNEDGEFVILQEGEKVTFGISFGGKPFIKRARKYYDVQMIRKGRATAHRPPASHPWRKGYGKSMDEQRW